MGTNRPKQAGKIERSADASQDRHDSVSKPLQTSAVQTRRAIGGRRTTGGPKDSTRGS